MTPTSTDDSPSSCLVGGKCLRPVGGGACTTCGYPRAYAHPESLLDAFVVEQVYIEGTAMQVYTEPRMPSGVVLIAHRDGRTDEHPIPTTTSDGPSDSTDERTPDERTREHAHARIADVAARILRFAGIDKPHGQRRRRQELAWALLDGVTNLLAFGIRELGATSRLLLEEAVSTLGTSSGDSWTSNQIRRILPDVQAMLAENEHARRSHAARRANLKLIDDRRPHVTWLAAGPFQNAFSRLRIALLPGDANHVRIYDLRIGALDDYPLGLSILDQVPEHRPELAREAPCAVDLGSRVTHRYLPGSLFAGTLRDGADAGQDDLFLLSPADLIGGSQIELRVEAPALSYVYLTYELDPGHVLCAVVEPIFSVSDRSE